MEHNGHELEVDRHATRRYRDVWVMRCSRCNETFRVGMRGNRPLSEKVAAMGLGVCPGHPPELPERPAPAGRHPNPEPMVIPSARIFGLDYRYPGGGDGEGD